MNNMEACVYSSIEYSTCSLGTLRTLRGLRRAAARVIDLEREQIYSNACTEQTDTDSSDFLRLRHMRVEAQRALSHGGNLVGGVQCGHNSLILQMIGKRHVHNLRGSDRRRSRLASGLATACALHPCCPAAAPANRWRCEAPFNSTAPPPGCSAAISTAPTGFTIYGVRIQCARKLDL